MHSYILGQRWIDAAFEFGTQAEHGANEKKPQGTLIS